MENIIELLIDIENERLDKFISSKIDMSRTIIQKLIKTSKVKVNGQVITSPKFTTTIGHKVEITNKIVYETKIKPVKMALDIKYEDDDLLIVNKPTGLVVHPGAGTTKPTLVHGLLFYLKNNISNKEDNIRPGIVHRLDKDTEGLLIIAKSDKAHRLLQEMIARKEVKRYYRSIVKGVMEHKKGTIDAPIMRDPKYRQKYIVGSSNSKDAITKFETIKIVKDISIVNIELLNISQINYYLHTILSYWQEELIK